MIPSHDHPTSARSGRGDPKLLRRVPNGTARGSRPSNGEPLTIWQGAARRPWAGTSWSARNAGIGRSPITPVAIAIAPSARPPPRPDGWRIKQPICCPCLTSMLSSRFPVISARSPFSNPRRVYGLLMQAAAETLIELAADPKHLGAKVGVLMTLHTWGQKLDLHPHVHCVVTGGGLSLDENHWVVGSDPLFSAPTASSVACSGVSFSAGLHTAFRRGKLRFPGKLACAWPTPDSSTICCRRPCRPTGSVYAKPPWRGPTTVLLKYLARYTHKTAISNRRLLSLEDGQVTFRWKDYAHGGRQWTSSHARRDRVRPPISPARAPLGLRTDSRHYGILANCHRREKLMRCRELL